MTIDPRARRFVDWYERIMDYRPADFFWFHGFNEYFADEEWDWEERWAVMDDADHLISKRKLLRGLHRPEGEAAAA